MQLYPWSRTFALATLKRATLKSSLGGETRTAVMKNSGRNSEGTLAGAGGPTNICMNLPKHRRDKNQPYRRTVRHRVEAATAVISNSNAAL